MSIGSGEYSEPDLHTPDPEWEALQKAAQQEKEERDKQRAKRQKRFAALIARIPSSLNDEQTRFMLGALVLGDLDRSCKSMAMRHVEDEDTNECDEDVCARILANLDTTSLPSFFAELALGSHTELPRAEQSDDAVAANRISWRSFRCFGLGTQHHWDERRNNILGCGERQHRVRSRSVCCVR